MLSTFLLLFVLMPLPQAAPIDVGLGSGGKFAFDWDGNYADGSPMSETTEVEFHYMPQPPIALAGIGTGDGHVTIRFPWVATVGENVVPMATALKNVSPGIYDLNLRLVGVGGNPSAYSTPVLALRVRVKKPAAPTNVRVVGS